MKQVKEAKFMLDNWILYDSNYLHGQNMQELVICNVHDYVKKQEAAFK